MSLKELWHKMHQKPLKCIRPNAMGQKYSFGWHLYIWLPQGRQKGWKEEEGSALFKLSTVESLLLAVEGQVITPSVKARNDKAGREITWTHTHSGTYSPWQTTLYKSTPMCWKTGIGPMTISETMENSAGSSHTATQLFEEVCRQQGYRIFTLSLSKFIVDWVCTSVCMNMRFCKVLWAPKRFRKTLFI